MIYEKNMLVLSNLFLHPFRIRHDRKIVCIWRLTLFYALYNPELIQLLVLEACSFQSCQLLPSLLLRHFKG